MTRLGGWAQPGMGVLDVTTEYEILWGGDRAKGLVLEQSAIYSGAMRDAGNTPTTVIRAGLLVGKITASSKLKEWSTAATDGSQNLAGVVPYELRAQDFDAVDADRVASIVVRAPLKAASLLIAGTVLTSHADEFLARRQLHGAGAILDDDPFGYKAGAGARVVAKTANYTITDADNGTLFTNSGAAGAVNFTLPVTPKRGLRYDFFVVANQNVTLTAGTVDTLVVYNDAAADSVALSTAGNLIGGGFNVISDGLGWLVFYAPGQTSDGTATGQRVTIVT